MLTIKNNTFYFNGKEISDEYFSLIIRDEAELIGGEFMVTLKKIND